MNNKYWIYKNRKKSMPRLNRNTKHSVYMDKKAYLPYEYKPRSRVNKILMFFITPIIGAFLLAGLFYVISYFMLYPKLKVRVSTDSIVFNGLVSCDVIISNPSNQDIANLIFGFRFDDKFPIKDVSITDTFFKSGIVLKIHEDIKVSKMTSRRYDKDAYVLYRSGFTGLTPQFVSGSEVLISLFIDKTYKGEMGDVFPPLSPPSLRSNSYFIKYKYKPLGVLSPMLITKEFCYDFDGNKSKADYYRSYTQLISFTDGERTPFKIDVFKMK